MFRFTIRDLLWLTVVVAVAMSFWLDHRRRNSLANLGQFVGGYQHRKEFLLPPPSPSAPAPNPPSD
jgi:hypothetical protein